MTTENRPVTVYMPDEIETALAKYCVAQGIIRKDGKPLLSTCILEILKGHLGLNASLVPIPSIVPDTDILEKMVKELVQELIPVSIPTFDDVVKPSQLDHRATSIIDEFNLKISQLHDRIIQLESQLGEKQPSKDAPETPPKTEKGQKQAKLKTATKPKKDLNATEKRKIINSLKPQNPDLTKHLTDIDKSDSDKLLKADLLELEKKFPVLREAFDQKLNPIETTTTSDLDQ